MLLALLFVAQSLVESQLVSGVLLLGEEIATPTYVRESVAERHSFSAYASMPVAPSRTPGMPAHVVAKPEGIGFTPAELERAVRTVDQEVWRGGFPGASLAIGRWNETVVERGFGTLDRGLGSMLVDPDHTLYDLASLTKIAATTMAVMLLVEDGRLELDAPVVWYLPHFTGGDKAFVTIRHLLTHTSGLPAGASISAPTPEQSLFRAAATPLRWRPGERVEYSDIGFIVLWAAAEAAAGEPLTDLLQRRIYWPLNMHSTGFRPGESCLRCAPTEDREGYRGVVHDPLARQLGGVAGHAGLFSTAHDLGRLAAMFANGGELDGVRVFQTGTLEIFAQRQPGAGARALGWETPDADGRGAGGLRISSSAFGHTGFTGTSLWIDPQRGTWTVLLSNRTFRPAGPNRMQSLRRELNDYVANSVD